MNKKEKIYNKILNFLKENFNNKIYVRKSKKSYSLYIIVRNKKIRISEHTNSYPTNDLFLNFIYSLEDSIYNILETIKENILKILLTK